MKDVKSEKLTSSHFSFLISRREGFTLLEVLVALSILAMALVMIMQLFSADMRSITASEDYVAATIKAEALMREVLDDPELKEQVWNFQTEDGYAVDVAVKKDLEDRTEKLNVELLDVTLTVRWKKGIKDRSLSLHTMKLIEKKV
ncbi:MAG: type IV pilus modification PilV family protein [Nitrospirota bacterium]